MPSSVSVHKTPISLSLKYTRLIRTLK
ncbi:hypothetical protein CLUP02_17724 [Colletotrichum lupini]|uniref:Uncharacterized protein n=1 Tax=Colletotrichum lupini TaxID=145971 RepID=A0A9Q8SFZ3_9PEZI|nr:hypothetical protein CLUP02_17724 [Colletotrichum lupini]